MKISELIEYAKSLQEKHGDLEICRKRTGARVKFRPYEVRFHHHKDVEISSRYIKDTPLNRQSITFDDFADCLYVELIEDAKSIDEFEIPEKHRDNINSGKMKVYGIKDE